MRQTGMIHNVLVTKDTGTILLSQYWDGSQAAERGKFEHNLYLQTLPEWSEIKPNKDDVDKVDQYKTHVALVENKCVVFKKVNDIVFFITGSGEYSELVLNGILDVIIEGFMAMFPKKRMWARGFEDDNTYGKTYAMLNEIIFMGQYCQSDITVADIRAKMKPIK